MIYDSGIWKIELEERTVEFKKLVYDTEYSSDWYFDEDENGWTESYKFFVEFQKYCFYSSVISRKFIESNRLSDELKSTNYKISFFKKKSSKILTKENFDSVDEEYYTDKELFKELTLEKICNLFVHSFVFSPKLDEYKLDEDLPDDDIENWDIKGISGLYINTDVSKDEVVFYFDLKLIFKIFEHVYKDKIIYISENRATKKIIRSKYPPKK